jgi:mitogen-activated protein kinase kinase kinase
MITVGAIPYYQYDNDWAVYYHIGKGELPKLPTSNEISDIGLEFIESSLTLIPNLRPKACDLLEHKWLLSNE